jgi:hypothetical protein
MMASNQVVADILEETVQAIRMLDLNRLKNVEEKISALAQYSITCGRWDLNTSLVKKHLVDTILQNCESNLDSLNRLHSRNTRDQWAH